MTIFFLNCVHYRQQWFCWKGSIYYWRQNLKTNTTSWKSDYQYIISIINTVNMIPFSIYNGTFNTWLPRWYLLTIVLFVFQFTPSDYPDGIFWPLYCLSFSLQLLITPMVSFSHCSVCFSLTYASDYPVGICWPLYLSSYLEKRAKNTGGTRTTLWTNTK